MEPSELDGTVRECLLSIFDEISPAEWRGREREIVSRFCFGHLIKSYDRERIGIEVAVPQLSKEVLLECNPDVGKPGQDVCKDIVIWSEPRKTAWDFNWKATYEPLAVMEWTVINRLDSTRARHDKSCKHAYDLCWLRKKSESVPTFTGYAVLVDATSNPKRLACARVSGGNVITNWVTLETPHVSRATATA